MKLTACVLGLVVSIVSCADAKKLQYINGPLDGSITQVKYKEPQIQVADILGITVFSENAAASALYNQSNTGGVGLASGAGVFSTAPTVAAPGYLVDNFGNIQFPGLGNLYVKGLTREQLTHLLTEKLDTLLTKPVCQVRFNNFKVTVIGEVNRPSIYSIPTEKISVFELLGIAGDLTPFARRDSILVVRELDSSRNFGWLNVNSPKIFESEYFYLKQNDVVIVNATKGKASLNDQTTVRNISLGISAVSAVAVIITLLTR